MAKGEAEVYRPAEACRIAEVAPYVLRYWETEFPSLSEGKDKGATKLYTLPAKARYDAGTPFAR